MATPRRSSSGDRLVLLLPPPSMLTLLLLFFVLTAEDYFAQCDNNCKPHCYDGTTSHCGSHYAYIGNVLSGTAIAGLIFGRVFIMEVVAAIAIFICLCMKNACGTRCLPHLILNEMDNPASLPPCPATSQTSLQCPLPPPYPGYTRK